MWFRKKRTDQDLLRMAIEQQFRRILDKNPPKDEFQRGYACALTWTWEQAGLPMTVEFMAVKALAIAPYVELRDS